MRALLTIFGVAICGASIMPCAHADTPAPKAKQGVKVEVVALKGNFMPGPAPEPGIGIGAPNRTTTPLAVPVHVFKGRIQVFEKPDPKHKAIVTVAKTDKNGKCEIGLEPGEYTIVAEINGKLYLNIMETDPATPQKLVWPLVKVEAGRWNNWKIEDTSEAAF